MEAAKIYLQINSTSRKVQIPKAGDTGQTQDNIVGLEGTGAYGALLLAPAESLGGPLGPLTCGGNLF